MWKKIGLLLACMFDLIISQNTGDLRLVGDYNETEGRLEVFYNDTWGTICDDDFTEIEGLVACRQLNVGYAMMNVQVYTSGNGFGRIWLDDINCTGLEKSIINCSHRDWGMHNCDHGEDVGIRCSFEGGLRLVGGAYYGRLEIYHNKTWGTICQNNFGHEEALVACKQLGLGTTDVHHYIHGNGNGLIWLDDIQCSGKEIGIDHCLHSGWSSHNCNHCKDVGIICNGSNSYFEGDVLLSESRINAIQDGFLSIYHDGVWRNVCGDSFTAIAALIACRQLRYRTSSVHFSKSYTTLNLTSMTNVSCIGTEQRLEDCDHSIWGTESCSQKVYLKCNGEYAVNGNWGPWSSCEGTESENQVKSRRRECDDPISIFGGMFCVGSSVQYECDKNDTKVDGNWGCWAPWSSCSMTCGVGFQERSRVCDNPSPSYGGQYCNASSYQIQSCYISGCPVDGGWGAWSCWEPCSVTCDVGRQTRTRVCDNPLPLYGGNNCTGSPAELQSCNNDACPVNGGWSQWSNWTECSLYCGGGTQNRSRECNNPPALNGGILCSGNSDEIAICNTMCCQVTNYLYRNL